MTKIIALIFSVFLFACAFTFESRADHKPTTDYNGLQWSQIPVMCGTTDAVNEYLVHNEFILESLSVGKENAKESGQNVYMVTYFINEKRTESMAVITSPSGSESFMLFRSFQLSFPGLML
jgi:hypothetical protein